MSWSTRRAVAVMAAVAVLGSLAGLQHALAQKGRRIQIAQPVGVPPPFGNPDFPPGTKPPSTATGDPSDLGGVSLPTNDQYKDRIEYINDYIDAEKWAEAVAAIQELLDIPEDVFVPVKRVGPGGKTSRNMVSVRAEAARLLAELPKNGLDYYRLTYNPMARELLAAAKKTSNAETLARVMRSYLYTESGAEATDLLATYLLDRGQYSAAALCYERLFRRDGPKELSPNTLFKAALAFQIAGDRKNVTTAWKHLQNKTKALNIGGKNHAIADLKQWVGKQKSVAVSYDRYDWPMFLGGPSRAFQAPGGTAFLEPNWKHETVRENQTKTWITRARQLLDQQKQPALHGFSPIAATVTSEQDGKIPLMVYKSYWGIHARLVKDFGEMKAGEIFWEAPLFWTLDRMVVESRYIGHLTQWMNSYLNNSLRPQVLFENSLVGTLSTDNVRAYTIEDLQVPPYGVNQQVRGQRRGSVYDPKLSHALDHNRLQAYNLESGKLVWEAGEYAPADKAADLPLANSYFLGPPLPLNGKLYVLNEKDQELRLLTLDPASGKLVGKPQRLADMKDKREADINRRVNAAHLSYGEGILVCPTNAGGLLGVDLLTNSLVWAYGYRDKGDGSGGQHSDPRFGVPPRGMIFNPQGRLVPASTTTSSGWKSCAPIIQEGKIIYTAPDASSVHCINLRDGSRVWKMRKQDGDLYVGGVFNGKVVVVGRQFTRGLSLEDGNELWRVDTGLPSGQGIASKDIYYLPIAESARTREPEICAIDVHKGIILAHTKSRKKEVPGDLLFYEGTVLSQSLTEVACYPQLDVILKEVNVSLARNPTDPLGLTQRGDLRLDKGDLGGAISDLRTALAHMDAGWKERVKESDDIEKKARTKLYESLTEYFQRDFAKAEEYLADYEAMCHVDTEGLTGDELKKAKAEEKKRLGNFYCLLGKGRESQGKLREAFEAYTNFGALGKVDNEMMSVVDDPGVRASPAVWSRGRISAMVAKATPEQRKPLEDVIARRWQEVKKDADVESLRNFVNTFGTAFAVGREARLQLAEKLLESSEPTALVDAERHLMILRVQKDDPNMAGRAVETLARLMTRKGLMDEAAHYYRVLGRDHAKAVIKDGKTGQDFYNELATDKRFLPYLDESAPLLGLRMGQGVEQSGNFSYVGDLFQFEQEGEKLPFFQKHKIAMRAGYNQLKVIDRQTGKDYWTQNLPGTHFQTLYQQRHHRGVYLQPRFTYQNLGHLVVLQIGHMVFGLDPVSRQKLWEKNLYGSSGTPQYRSHTVDPRDGTIEVAYTDGWVQRLGQAGPLSPSAVCLVTRDELVALDPVSGNVLWTRSDLPKKCHLYNDSEYIFVVEVGNDGAGGAARAYRAHDGVEVDMKDFSALYQKRVRMAGRTVLAAEEIGKGVRLRLYDVIAGETRWSMDFPAGSKVMECEDEWLTGVVEPNGKVTVVDLGRGGGTPPLPKPVMTARMKPEHIGKAEAFKLFRDPQYFYVGVQNPVDPKVLNGSLMTNLMPNTGLRAEPINGMLYSFEAATGNLQWYYEHENQMVVRERFQDLPVVILTSRYRRWADQNRGRTEWVIPTEVRDKRTGKLLWRDEDNSGGKQQYHTVRVDEQDGVVQLISYQKKLTFAMATGEKTSKAGGPGAGRGPGGAKSTPRGVDRVAPVLPPPPVRPVLPRLRGVVPRSEIRLQIERR